MPCPTANMQPAWIREFNSLESDRQNRIAKERRGCERYKQRLIKQRDSFANGTTEWLAKNLLIERIPTDLAVALSDIRGTHSTIQRFNRDGREIAKRSWPTLQHFPGSKDEIVSELVQRREQLRADTEQQVKQIEDAGEADKAKLKECKRRNSAHNTLMKRSCRHRRRK